MSVRRWIGCWGGDWNCTKAPSPRPSPKGRGSKAMSEYIQVTTTTGTRHDAEQIASELVSRRLAACVQITGPINSTFRWQGKVETAEEWMCTVKTTRARF